MPIGDVDEIVIDIDSLDTATLRDLEQYVLRVKKKKVTRRRTTTRTQQTNTVNNEEVEKERVATAQRIENIQKRIAEIQQTSDRSLLTNSTTIAFATPLDASGEVKNDGDDGDDGASDSESASDTDSDASSESGSDNDSGSDNEDQ